MDLPLALPTCRRRRPRHPAAFHSPLAFSASPFLAPPQSTTISSTSSSFVRRSLRTDRQLLRVAPPPRRNATFSVSPPSPPTTPPPPPSSSSSSSAARASAARAAPSNAARVKELLQRGGAKLAPQLDLSRASARTGLGLYVSAPVLKGTELAVLPEALCLTPRQARAHLDRGRSAAARAALADLSDEAAMATALLQYRAEAEQSSSSSSTSSAADVAALLAALLPAAIDAAPLWSDEQLARLAGSPLRQRALDVRDGVRREFEQAAAALRDEAPPWLADEDAFRWAAAAVDARSAAASSAEPLVLSAVVCAARVSGVGGSSSSDADTDADTDTDTDGGGSGGGGAGVEAGAELRVDGGLFFSKRRFTLVATRNLAAGEEVTLAPGISGDSAGGAMDAELVLERGVAYGGSGAAEAELEFELAQLDRFFDDKADILQAAGVATGPSFALRAAAAGSGKWAAPADMDAFLRLVCLAGADTFLLEGVFRGDVWGFMELPVSEENERAVCNLVIGAVEDALDQYPPGDAGAAANQEEGEEEEEERYRAWLAATVTRGEQEVLQAAAEHYRRQVESLDALEYYAERRLNALDLLRPVDECEIVDSESGARASRAFDENFY